MEETKYYQPEIEEFHVGFEYESYDLTGKGGGPIPLEREWKPKQYTGSWFDTDGISTDAKVTKLEYTRVKCLDQEDIESFGFKLWTYKGNELGFMLNPDEDGSTWIHRIEGKIKISTTFPDTTLYLGTIKNKSELRWILKALQILE